jgi:hypothetical protein
MRLRLPHLLLGLAIGLAAGLLYGWLISPVEYVDTTPDSLRLDYRTDYVLMVAEAYAADQNLELARVRLAALGTQPPTQILEQALEFALQVNFNPSDLIHLERLTQALNTQEAQQP